MPTRTALLHVLVIMGCGASRTAPAKITALPSPHPTGSSCDPAKEAYACSPDGMQVLVCDAGRWRVAGSCAGAGHCTSTASKLKCDDTLAGIGAPCATEGDNACASDGSVLLACTKGAMVETSRCRGPKACAVSDGVPTCDRTIAEPGDRCDAEREVACTPKGDAVVECRSHVMVQTTVCNCRVSVAGTSVRCM